MTGVFLGERNKEKGFFETANCKCKLRLNRTTKPQGREVLIDLIVLVATVMCVVVWLIYFYNFVPDWMDTYSTHVLSQMERQGATADELASQKAQLEQFSEMYENPFLVVLFTIIEVAPVGLLVALIAALLLKRKS